ncbi:LysR substrate-binding domain-containing protein [Sphingopyxis sp. LC81]|uniref:LysR substrate-binding domain-containing protein n=1 Tax=Sphingopyxis sp. LC81 TaxID=1502850 RepID=UPI00055A5F98|nr:LysR substrate-binding domain-containing protein [Sphingopyxis sp. LC81]
MTHSSYDLPPLDGLTALLAAAEEGSFSGAAAKLGLTHGSVSRRIASLEHWLGASLFERHGRGVRLTPAGLRFTHDTRQSLGRLSHSAEQWRPRRGRQTVRMSVVPSFARLWLLPHLAAIERNDTHIDLSLDHRTMDLDAREAEIVIRYGRGTWVGVDAKRIMRESLTPVASPDLQCRTHATAAIADLLQWPLLHDSDTSQWRTFLSRAGISYRPRWQDRRFEDYDTVLAAAEAGLGIALLRQPLASDRLAHGRLISITSEHMENPAGHFACVRAGEARQAVLTLRDRIVTIAHEDTQGKAG